jgi:Ran GTPase-activating protein 1
MSVWFLLPDYPHNTKAWYITEEDKRLTKERAARQNKSEITGIIDLKLAKRMFGNWRWWMLGEALAKGGNVKLEVLRLQFNEIDAKGLKAISDAAAGEKALPRLRRVELNGNKFAEEDESIAKLQAVLEKRKEEQAEDFPGVDEDDEDAWGVDELDELEDDEDDEDEDEDADDLEAEEEQIVKDADEAEAEHVAAKNDKDVDDLADSLGKTEIK